MSIRISSLDGGGKLEELSAWDSYHEVARTARVFTARSEQRRSITATTTTTTTRTATRSNFNSSTHRHQVEQTCTALSAEAQSRFESSQREWFQYFGAEEAEEEKRKLAAAAAAAAAASDGEKSDDNKEDQVVVEQPLSKNLPILSEGIRRDIYDIFSIYFEGSYHDTKRRETIRRNPALQFVWGVWENVNATMPRSQRYIVDLAHGVGPNFFARLLLFVEFNLRGIGQVFFQNSPMSGLLILVGLLWQSTRVAVHGLLALVCGNLTVYLLGFNMGLARCGLFGYNAVLVGLALATFASPKTHEGYTVDTLCFSAFVGLFSSILFVTLGKLLFPYKSPPLTLPFNIATLLFLLATSQMARVEVGQFTPSVPAYDDNDDDLERITASQFFKGVIRGLGQVFLADEVVAGIFVLAGLAVSSRIAALAALVGSALGGGVALATGVVDPTVVAAGLYGYNAALTVTALFTFYAPSWGAAILAAIAGVLTVLCQQALMTLLQPWGLPVMTLPFCIVTLPFIILQGTTSIVIAVPLEQLTVPEDHVHKVQTLRDGIHFLKDAIHGAEHKNMANGTRGGAANEAYGGTMRRSMQQVELAIANPEAPVRGGDKRLRWAQEAAKDIFSAVASEGAAATECLHSATFLEALAQAGMTDRSGRQFVSLVFDLMDLDRSNAIDEKEFVALCMVSCAIAAIRRKISKFLDFVDLNGNGSIDFDEIDAALEYLGQAALSTEDHKALAKMMGVASAGGEMEVVDLINFLTVQKLKSMVTAYHNSTDASASSVGGGGAENEEERV